MGDLQPGTPAAEQAGRAVGEVTGTSLLVSLLVGVGFMTLVVTWAFEGAHNGRVAGNEAMAVSAVWGSWGFLMALTDTHFPSRRLRHGARGTLAAALLYLVLGALQGNGQWAEPFWRFLGYAGVLGSIWGAEYVMRARDAEEEIGGLLSLTAAAVGFGAIAFEVERFLIPLFTIPVGEWVTPEWLAWQDSTRTFWIAGLWGPYAAMAMAAGAWRQSPKARLLATAMALIGLLYAAVWGLTNPAASWWLRAGSIAALSGGVFLAAAVGVRARGERHRWEARGLALLRYGALVLLGAAAWLLVS